MGGREKGESKSDSVQRNNSFHDLTKTTIFQGSSALEVTLDPMFCCKLMLGMQCDLSYTKSLVCLIRKAFMRTNSTWWFVTRENG